MLEFDEEIFLKTYKSAPDKAFKMLLEKYQERLYWHIRKIVISHENADDVLQNTFIKIWKGLENFNRQSNLYTWMYRIATNEALTHLKQQRKHSLNHVSEDVSYLVAGLEADPYFNGNEIELKLQKALAKLPDKQRLVFNMKYFDNMKYDEISEILNTSVGGLKASYHIAVKKIKEYLSEN